MHELRIAVQRAAKAYRGGVEALSKQLGIDGQVLRNRLNGQDRHPLYLSLAEEIIDLCDSDELAHAAAMMRGGVFIKLPDSDAPASDRALVEIMAKVWCAHGDIGRAVDEALADGKVERVEVAAVRQVIYRSQHALTEMLQRLEGMAE